MRTHDAWLIDLDGTLYTPKPLKWAMGAEVTLLGMPVLRTLRHFRRLHEVLREEGESFEPSPFDEQLRRTAQILKVSAGDVDAIVQEWMIQRPCKWLQRLQRKSLLREITAFRAEGGRTAVVSDYPAKVKLAALGVSNLFDRVIANGEEGGPKRLKPFPDGLLLAASALEVEPRRCLVVGDRKDADGAAASNAGMEFRLIQ
jgi:HAD superfamily hydrolase (TIGR01549 family)